MMNNTALRSGYSLRLQFTLPDAAVLVRTVIYSYVFTNYRQKYKIKNLTHRILFFLLCAPANDVKIKLSLFQLRSHKHFDCVCAYIFYHIIF
jgi:hypothetical protein